MSRTETSSGGRERGRVERVGVDGEQRPPVLHAEQQRLGAARSSPASATSASRSPVHEHRRLGEDRRRGWRDRRGARPPRPGRGGAR